MPFVSTAVFIILIAKQSSFIAAILLPNTNTVIICFHYPTTPYVKKKGGGIHSSTQCISLPVRGMASLAPEGDTWVAARKIAGSVLAFFPSHLLESFCCWNCQKCSDFALF